MQHVNCDRTAGSREDGWKAQFSRINIAAHRFHGSNGAQLVKHRLGPHIAGVQNQVNTVKQRGKMRVKISVSVGNDAEGHRSQELGVRSQASGVRTRSAVFVVRIKTQGEQLSRKSSGLLTSSF